MFVEQLFNNIFLNSILDSIYIALWWGEKYVWMYKREREREWDYNVIYEQIGNWEISFIFTPPILPFSATLNISVFQFNQLQLVSHSFTDCTHNRIQERENSHLSSDTVWCSALLCMKIEIRVEKQRKNGWKSIYRCCLVGCGVDVNDAFVGVLIFRIRFFKIRINWRE